MNSTSYDWRNELHESDIDAIAAMVKKVGVFSEEECAIAVELAQDQMVYGENSDYLFIVASSGDHITGYTCYGRIPFTDERYDLYWIVVDPAHQKTGFATELFTRTESALRALGAKGLYAETSSRAIYISAQRFYLKSGFAEEARLKDFYKDGDDKLIYSKMLT